MDMLKDSADRADVYSHEKAHPSMASLHSFTLGDDFEDNAQSFVNSPAFCSKTNDFLHPLPYVSVDEDATNIYGLLQDILKYCTLKKKCKRHPTQGTFTANLWFDAECKQQKSQ